MFEKWIRTVFYLIGTGNICAAALVAVPLYDSTLLTHLYPEVFSPIGLGAIGLWGLAYIAIGSVYDRAPVAVLVLAIEKLFYASLWAPWIMEHWRALGGIFSADPIAGLVYASWGPYDFVSCLFFIFVYIRVTRGQAAGRTA